MLHIEIFVTFFAVALALSLAAERIGIPAPVLLVCVGALVHGIFHVQVGFNFGPTLLFIFLPPLIFEAAWNLNLVDVQRKIWYVLYLAIPGTLFSAAAVTVALTLTHVLMFPAAFILGTIIAATDPIAVVSVFRKVQIPSSLKTIVEAESLLNDGIAVVLYGIALAIALPELTQHSLTLTDMALRPIYQIGVGSLLGALLAIPAWLALRATQTSEYEVAMTVVLAYVSYLSADRLGCSGIIATTFSAIAMRALQRRHTTLSNRDDVNIFWRANATLVNTFVFFATGLVIEPYRIIETPLLVFMAFSGMIISRAILAFTAANNVRSRVTVFMAGMRGSLPLALALSLPHALKERDIIVNGVAASVLLSLFINGIPLEPVMRRLYPKSETL